MWCDESHNCAFWDKIEYKRRAHEPLTIPFYDPLQSAIVMKKAQEKKAQKADS